METKTGVYQIYFTEDIPKRYIGSSKDIKTRRSCHKHLQEVYNKYGIT